VHQKCLLHLMRDINRISASNHSMRR
jgi:hypothetical protein